LKHCAPEANESKEQILLPSETLHYFCQNMMVWLSGTLKMQRVLESYEEAYQFVDRDSTRYENLKLQNVATWIGGYEAMSEWTTV
jgi:hypothetical protein